MTFPCGSEDTGTSNDNANDNIEAVAVSTETTAEHDKRRKSTGGYNGAGTNTSRATDNRGDDNSTNKPATAPASSPGTSHASDRPVKKMKRGKYISRACSSCQQRKIKCEGGEPCAQCVARKRPCVPAPRGNQAQSETSGVFPTRSEHDTETEIREAHRDVLARLAKIERQLSFVQPAAQTTSMTAGRGHPHASMGVAAEHGSPDSAELQSVLEADGQTFAGELSISPAFQDMSESLDGSGIDDDPSHGKGNAAASAKGTFLRRGGGGDVSSSGDHQVRKVRGWLEAILAHHGVLADEAAWRWHLQVFFDEVHVLYPFLHAPTVWETFDELWEYSALWAMTNAAEREHKRMSVAVVCFCLALGRCSVSSRMADASGVHSSGWSLYSVGMSLVQDAVEMNNMTAKSLVALQIIMLRILYLFRLDATQRAARLVAVAVSNAHIIGLHRQQTLDQLPVFRSQLFCRTWWSIYVLDRRIAIESGRPFLIQDANVDTDLPPNLSDEWLSRYASRAETTGSLGKEISIEDAADPVTAIPYLAAQVRFSRVMGKSWELLYGIRTPSPTSTAMADYADAMLCKILEKAPSTLSYDPNLSSESQFGSRLRWQVKQSILLFMSCTFLRLLIRRPFSGPSNPPGRSDDEELESVTVCSSLAASILNAYGSIREDDLKYCFPFSHYLTSATMVMLGLIATEPILKNRHGSLVLDATRSLNLYCHRIWVSGKMMRWVSRLNVLVRRLISNHLPEDRSRGGAAPDATGHAGSERASETVPQLRTQPETQDLPQPPYPHSEDCCMDDQPDHGMSGSASGPGNQGQMILTPEEDENQRAPLSPYHHHAGGGRPPPPNKSISSGGLWTIGSGPGGEDNTSHPSLPEWALSDFGFETLINGDGTTLVPSSTTPGEPSRHPPGTGVPLQEMDCRDPAALGQDIDHAMFGALGPSGLFNLDFEVDQVMKNLENSAGPTF